ncbi:LOW QUALITY PROTEIN: protein GRINL1A [Gracilinanus agilis]|uniref:LOW QUALITY PROTEIN: protein GRINL1A n=1 Tax=Gracilinanus agilis TaxID=191870 RepID=UPI001CFD5EA5|nr:LOW QUALITY PROTEIN: protein GRINL1A [Gracilinanus agilis]
MMSTEYIQCKISRASIEPHVYSRVAAKAASSRMSSAPPGSAEDLRKRSLGELREMLGRQEKLLRNEKFVRSLPDGGKKISDFVERVKSIIAEHEELKRTNRLDFDLKQTVAHEIFNLGVGKPWTPEQRRETSSVLDSSLVFISEPSQTASRNQEIESTMETSVPISHDEAGKSEGDIKCNKKWMSYNNTVVAMPSESNEQSHQFGFLNHAGDVSGNTDDMFIDSLQRITINDDENQSEDSNMDHLGSYPSNIPKRPHYMEVLEMRAKNPVPPHNKFRTNMLPSEPQSSPSHSPQRRESPISVEERRRRDKKHLDDITAARLPPLYHMPTQLLSMEESLAIQKQQKQNYEEIQAKLAAQKLAERLNIKMQSYNPEGDASMKYREVRDEDDYHSSED